MKVETKVVGPRVVAYVSLGQGVVFKFYGAYGFPSGDSNWWEGYTWMTTSEVRVNGTRTSVRLDSGQLGSFASDDRVAVADSAETIITISR